MRKYVHVVQDNMTGNIYGIFPTEYQAELYINNSRNVTINKLPVAAKLTKKQIGITQ